MLVGARNWDRDGRQMGERDILVEQTPPGRPPVDQLQCRERADQAHDVAQRHKAAVHRPGDDLPLILAKELLGRLRHRCVQVLESPHLFRTLKKFRQREFTRRIEESAERKEQGLREFCSPGGGRDMRRGGTRRACGKGWVKSTGGPHARDKGRMPPNVEGRVPGNYQR